MEDRRDSYSLSIHSFHMLWEIVEEREDRNGR